MEKKEKKVVMIYSDDLDNNRREEKKRILRLTWFVCNVLVWGVFCPSALLATGIVCLVEDCGNPMFPYWFIAIGGVVVCSALWFIIICVFPTCVYYLVSYVKGIHIPEYSIEDWANI